MAPSDAHEIGRSGAEFFQEHGWWVSPDVLTEGQLEELEYGVERFYADDLDWHLPAVPPGDTARASASVTRQNDYVSLQVAEVRAFVLEHVIGSLLAGISGHSSLRLFHDQLITKSAGPERVGWHSDRSYWLTCSAVDMLTIWVPVCDVDEANGALQVVDGSHRWSLDHDGLRGFHDGTTEPPTSQDASPIVSLAVRRGQVSFHHARTVHASGASVSATARTALAIHAQPASNRYQRPPSTAPRLHFNDVLCRRDESGLPDYADPHVCPLLWSVGGDGDQ